MLDARTILLAAVLGAAATLPAQGSQRPLGGGCAAYSPPAVSGPLTVGSTLSIDGHGCQIPGAHSVQLLFFGVPLPQSSWIRLRLVQLPFGPRDCDVVLSPLAFLDLSGQRLPTTLPIPNDPRLRGARIALQSYCYECGAIGCYDALTQGLEVTIG